MICLSKILEDNVRFGMIRFRKLFEMIFRFGNAPPSKIQAIWFSLSHPPYLRPENHLFSMIRKMKYLTDMIRGKSPSASEMRKRAGHREEGLSRRAPRSFRKEDTLCHFKKMGRSHSEKRSHKSKRKSKTNPNAVPKWKSYLSFENDDLQSFRNDCACESAKRSAINLYAFRRVGHTSSFRNERAVINLHRESMINLYMISFWNDGHMAGSFWKEGHLKMYLARRSRYERRER